MRRAPHHLLRLSACLTLALVFAACSDSDTNSPTRPLARAFTTPTGLVTSNPPQVFVGAGDITSCSTNNDELTAELLDQIPGTVYVLGDDAYDNGTASEFANCYGPTWGRHKSRTYPSPGNHEYNSSGAAPYFAYFGTVAGTPGQGWYSFNLGAWHIISLNSNISLNTGGTQDTWLKADLAAHPHQCTLAYYHHPLYSSTGGTGTGGLVYSSSRMFVNDLYAAHADLILNGHRHFYERLAPMNPSGGYDSTNGVRELIAGTGGIGGGDETDQFPLHEAGNGRTFGVLKLWLYDDSYAWKFVPIAGQTYTDSGSTPCHSAGSGGGGSGVSAGNSTVAAAPASFTAGNGSSTITVTAKDAGGNTIGGATVTLAASGSGNTLTPASGATSSSGVFTSKLTSTVAETKTISATINGTAITQTASVTVNPVPSVSASLSTVDASPTTFTAGASTTITVTVLDGSSNPLGGVAVALSASGTGNTITQPAATTSNGVTTGTYSSTAAGPHTVTVTAGGVTLSQQPALTVTAGPADGAKSTVVAQPTSIDQGTGTATITVTVKDTYGNPVTGSNVVLTASGSGNTLTGGGATSTAGVATGTLSSTVAETKVVSATAGGTAITQTASVTVTVPPPPVSASVSTVAASPTSFPAGGNTSITVTVVDGNNNPLSGVVVTLSASGSGNTITQPPLTNTSGITTGTLGSTSAGSHVVAAVAAGITLTQQPVVSVTAGPADAGKSTLTALPASITQGTGTSTITVIVRDAFGNPVSGSNVALAASGSGNTLAGGGATNTSGVATGALSSTVVESKVVSATADAVPITQTATVTVTPQGSGSPIAQTLLTAGHDTVNTQKYTTASIAPAPNTLVTVAVLMHRGSATPPIPTLSGGGMASWDLVASVPYDGTTPTDMLTIFRAMSAAPGSGPITITSSATVSNCQWVVSQWSGVDLSGTNGSGAIVQTASASGTAITTLTAALATFANSNDVAYGIFGVANNTAVITPGSGFTTIDQEPSGEGTVGDLLAEWAFDLLSVTATWPSKNAGALGVEIKAGP